MAWPTGQQYSEVVQNPRSAFEDAELQGGSIETDRLGLPKPRSGNFAVVYKMDCGPRSWAVKCFTREVADQQTRYAAISAHLRGSAIPYVVGFDYFVRGIRVRGQWFPVLKMEWVSGEPLIRCIEGHLRDPASLLALASRWFAMIKALRAAGIAHGDLQHGNVLVTGGELKLVDYDGMFVPALAGIPGTEVGHPNYQHPGRATLSFGPNLDNFSAWTVYVSLIALSIDSSLWSRVNAGDDCLLFRAGDFAAPNRSQVFRTLGASPDERLRSLVEVYGELVRLRCEQVPPLDGPRIPVPAAAAQPQNRPGWLDDHVKPAPATATTGTGGGGREAAEIDASWVLDFVAPGPVPEDARFAHGVLLLRLAFVSSVVLAIVAVLTLPGPVLPAILLAALIAVNLGVIAARYRTEPGRASLHSARAALTEVGSRFRAAAARVEELEKERRARVALRDRDIANVEVRIRAVDEQATREIDAVKRRLEAECAPTRKRRRQIDSDEQTASANVARGTGARAVGLKNQLRALVQEEATESATTLTALQSIHLRSALSSATVAQAQIHGVGPQLKRALMMNGITSAQDVDQWKVHRISGFGPARVSVVVAWAHGVDQRARATMPQALPASQAQALRAKYEGRRQSLAAELQRVEGQQRSEEAAIKAKFSAMRQELDNLEAAPRAAAERETQEIQRRRDQAVTLLKKEEERVAGAARADLATLDVRATELRRSSFGLQWEKTRATARVKAYAPVTFGRYLKHVGFGSGKAG